MYPREFLMRIVAVVLCISLPFCNAQQQITVHPSSDSGEEGSDFSFICNAPGTDLKWNRVYTNGTENPTPLVDGDKYGVYFILTNDTTQGNLTIKKATTADSGTYNCKSGDLAFGAVLTVYPVKDVVISPAEPEFVEGGDLQLNCTVNGATDQTVSWSVNKGNGEEPLEGGDDTSHIQVFNDGSLIIRAMLPDDAGIYICTHTFPEDTKSVSVNVGGEITLTAENSVKFTEGDRALLKCEAHVITSALLPNITWLIEGEDVDEACPSRCEVTQTATTHTVNSQLEILKITMEDRKNYTCIASNSATEASKDILLRVRDRLAALWPFLGIVSEVVILIIIIFIHEKCSKGEDIGEDDEDDDDDIKKEKKKITDDNEMTTGKTKE